MKQIQKCYLNLNYSQENITCGIADMEIQTRLHYPVQLSSFDELVLAATSGFCYCRTGKKLSVLFLVVSDEHSVSQLSSGFDHRAGISVHSAAIHCTLLLFFNILSKLYRLF